MTDENIWFGFSHKDSNGHSVFHTVTFCEDCKSKRQMYSSGFMKYKCTGCGALYKYSKSDNRMMLIRHGSE